MELLNSGAVSRVARQACKHRGFELLELQQPFALGGIALPWELRTACDLIADILHSIQHTVRRRPKDCGLSATFTARWLQERSSCERANLLCHAGWECT